MAEESEIFYHVFQRSFYDSNGDRHGDLKGLELKLDYIKDMGFTSIIILPLYDSPYYHNYFANDFREIDPHYGTFEDYLNLVKAIHERGMKIYLDMEVHYITEDHEWFIKSFGNPNSEFSDHIIYNDEYNLEPESVIFDIEFLESYHGVVKRLVTLNLNNEKVQNFIKKEFQFWLDPLQNGNKLYAADGFRIDHMMDDLDLKGKLRKLLGNFWKPLIEDLRRMNPSLKILGEQGDWLSYGAEYFEEAGVDYMFAFNMKIAITAFDKYQIIHHAENMINANNERGRQALFIENHDTNRFASDVQNHPDKIRIGATLNLLLKGIPCIYYGQELGMLGVGGFEAYGLTDGNDIPRREAFPWFAKVKEPGVALWYEDSGPWWEDSCLQDNDGISVEEQYYNPYSLLNYYKSLIRLRLDHPAIAHGTIIFFENNNPHVLTFGRKFEKQIVYVNVNLNEYEEKLELNNKAIQILQEGAVIFSKGNNYWLEEHNTFSIDPYGVFVIKIELK